MNQLNQTSQTLLKELAYLEKAKEIKDKGEIVKISKAVSNLAIVYESVRNAVEFQAEHLIRQAAINRILKRRFLLNQTGKKVALSLIRELLWAHYLKEDSVSKEKVKEIETIIEKYRFAIHLFQKNSLRKKNKIIDWILGMASCEIEESLVFNPTQQILINFVYESLVKRIDFEEKKPETKSIQIYIAVERGFGQNSEALISYRLLKTAFPGWKNNQLKLDKSLKRKLVRAYDEIDLQLNYPLGEKLRQAVLKTSAPFNLIKELFEKNKQEFGQIILNPERFKQEAEELLENLYGRTQEKLNRASTRSIVYIFLTKMLFGLLIELPFDIISGGINYLALGINAFFPPTLLFLLNISVKAPDKENTFRLIEKTKDYLYNPHPPKTIFIEKRKTIASLEKIFFIVYLLTYILIFGTIVWILSQLGFNFISQIVFLFFLTVVSFFAYRIRKISKDFLLPESTKEGFVSSLVDFIFLPIIKVGQWLSFQISQFNILSLILDFIIEAPLKSFLGVIEEWIRFVRIKKEEIID